MLHTWQLTDCNSPAVQAIRLFVDVLFLGPLLIFIGLTPLTRLPLPLRSLLVAVGVGTIVFNAVNFFLIESRK